jgi:hypothetical protein
MFFCSSYVQQHCFNTDWGKKNPRNGYLQKKNKGKTGRKILFFEFYICLHSLRLGTTKYKK